MTMKTQTPAAQAGIETAQKRLSEACAPLENSRALVDLLFYSADEGMLLPGTRRRVLQTVLNDLDQIEKLLDGAYKQLHAIDSPRLRVVDAAGGAALKQEVDRG
jgi:hypothetical protein